MRGWILIMTLALPAAAFADGDPKSLAPPPPAPAIVEVAPPPVAAAEPPMPVTEVVEGPVAPVHSEGFGSDVRYWVALQNSGAESVKELRPISGEVAKRTYDRYLKSFEHPIPETYKRESFTAGTGGGQ
jgi:hypothetical protein